MDAAVGYSGLGEPSDGIDEALGQLRDFGRADFALVFATSEYAESVPLLARRVRQALGAPTVLGGSTSAVIDATGEHERQPGLGILALRGVRARAALASSADDVARLLAEPGALHLVLADPRRFEGGLRDALFASRGPAVGGGLSGRSEDIFALADEAAGEGPCALAALGGLEAQVEIAQGAEPNAPWLAVTSSRRNAVLELQAMPAAPLLGAHLRALGEAEDQLPNLLFAAMRHPGNAGFTVRPIVGVDEAAGAILLPDAVAESTELAFAWRETLSAGRALGAALGRICADVRPVRALLYFNCAGRGSSLYLEPDADIARIRRALPGVPVLGMTSSFELASQAGALDLLMYCGVLVALRDG